MIRWNSWTIDRQWNTPNDILFYAEHESYVSSNGLKGSWFMQSLLAVFESHYKHEHVDDMMTVVNLKVAEKRNCTIDGTSVCQMPCKQSTLRFKFYLWTTTVITNLLNQTVVAPGNRVVICDYFSQRLYRMLISTTHLLSFHIKFRILYLKYFVIYLSLTNQCHDFKVFVTRTRIRFSTSIHFLLT